MKNRRVLIAVLLTILCVVIAVPAGATPPSGVSIEVETSFLGDPSPFTAVGPAVDYGLICNTGTVVEASSNVIGFSRNGIAFAPMFRIVCRERAQKQESIRSQRPQNGLSQFFSLVSLQYLVEVREKDNVVCGCFKRREIAGLKFHSILLFLEGSA